MEKFIIGIMFLLMTTSSFCQQTDFNKSLTRQDYLKKSKNQKTAAWVLLGGGTAAAVGAIILDASGATSAVLDASAAALNGSSYRAKSETPYLVALSVGCASILGSIPLFIASGRNKRKAMNASTYFEIRQNPVLTNTGLALHSTPTLSLKLNF